MAGLRLADVGGLVGAPVPADLKRAKGWVGLAIEAILGATAASRAEPDFPDLGVELKTLPVGADGKPLESTFVCTIELSAIADAEWSSSRVRKKLSDVLWVPVEGARSIPVAERRVGTPFLWVLAEEEEELLRADWDRLVVMMGRGRTAEITGHWGEALQVRPKAARGSSRRRTNDEDGGLYDEQPKGFYLRATFTHALLARHLHLPRGSRR